ncbi:RND family efflux transporter MFP subunit [Edaphobacter aggregans]|uniref:RND family efflux transporter MFP subunit n=1 Tax=Edaphobacter aggregans TaxID=570835 RepID=A0A428MHC5_9BACT|nr:efflux RND transporter periplasmic adaptor subunit [Edaphobacter aggregans]RSL16267.1 RND family efflux transporter MFP subunit [Edaphobacter aggregans]
MTHTPHAEHQSSSRTPYVGAALFFLVLIVIGVLALMPKLRHRDELRVEAQEAVGPPVVLATKLKSGEAGGHLEIAASVQAFDQTPVFARTSGYVKARYVDIGDHVRQGQLLAVIDDPQTAQALMQAKATLAQLKAQLAQAQANAQLSNVTNERWQGLVKQGVVSKQDADQRFAQAGADVATVAAAQANIAAGEANVRNLAEQESFSRVTAPFSGVILSRSIDKGSLISSGSQSGVTQMFTIGQSETVRVFASVPQASAGGLFAGHVAKVTFREVPGQVYTGTVARTSQSLDPGTRTLLTEVDLKNDGRILPGMYATTIFDLPRGTVAPVLLPANALVIRTAGPQAVVLDGNNIAHFRSIALGRDLGSATEVVSGLKAGDIVVLSPGDGVVDGAKVEPNMQQ